MRNLILRHQSSFQMYWQLDLAFGMVLLSLFFVTATLAAPMPLTSSSVFISSKKGLFHSPLGFSIHSANTDWVQMPPPKGNSYIETIYRAGTDDHIQAALTVRTDKMTKAQSLDAYAKKWMKDYPRFGFDVLAAKKVKVGEEVGFLLDLVSRDNSKQLRQILFVKNKNAVTLTCRDDQKSFSQTLKSCNEIIRTFRW